MISRRSLLKLLASGVIGHTLDVDRLLWVPGQKTIFLPSTHILTESQIVAKYMEIYFDTEKLRKLFERDDTFYKAIIWDKHEFD